MQQWLEKTQVVYNAKAQEAGIYLLEACGFDSVPAELGLQHAKKQFDGTTLETIIQCVFHLVYIVIVVTEFFIKCYFNN